MNRQELIEKLKPFIPSYQREFADEDIFGKNGWMFNDSNLPKGDIVPAGFLEGTKVLRDGKEFEIISKDDVHRKFENAKFPEGRGVYFEYHNYAGNPHLYGNVVISGVVMVYYNEKTDKFISTSPNSEECRVNPALMDARYAWSFSPCRIVPKEEIEAYPRMWDMTDPGCRTQRFVDAKELTATVIVACLQVVQGPFFLTYGTYSYRYNSHNCYIAVTSEDEVVLNPLIIKRFNL